MVVIFVAMFLEAKPLIDRFELKKCPIFSIYDTYISNDNKIMLVVTGVGPINGATSVAYTLGVLSGSGMVSDFSSLFVLNVGICGAKDVNMAKAGDMFLVNKLVDCVSGKTFYPDMIVSNVNKEASIYTSYELYTGDEEDYDKVSTYRKKSNDNLESADKFFYENVVLHDCEAAYIYQAAYKQVSPHQIGFLKIVSDFGNTDTVTREQVAELVEQNVEDICSYIAAISKNIETTGDDWQDTNENSYCSDKSNVYAGKKIEQIGQDLKCSETMLNELRQLVKYCVLSGIDIEKRLTFLYENAIIPVTHKKDGKKIIDELKESLTR